MSRIQCGVCWIVIVCSTEETSDISQEHNTFLIAEVAGSWDRYDYCCLCGVGDLMPQNSPTFVSCSVPCL